MAYKCRAEGVLKGIHPILSGELLAHLDAMGHSDAVVLADAHFPAIARRPAAHLPRLVDTRVLAAVLHRATAETSPARPDGSPGWGPAAGAGRAQRGGRGYGGGRSALDRLEFYDVAAEAFLIVRTGETRTYGNVILRKGVVD